MELKETVIKKPVAIGDTVFYMWREFDMHGKPDIFHITKTTVVDMSVKHGLALSCDGGEKTSAFHRHGWDELFGSIFLTRDEAISAVESEYGYDGKFLYDEA